MSSEYGNASFWYQRWPKNPEEISIQQRWHAYRKKKPVLSDSSSSCCWRSLCALQGTRRAPKMAPSLVTWCFIHHHPSVTSPPDIFPALFSALCGEQPLLPSFVCRLRACIRPAYASVIILRWKWLWTRWINLIFFVIICLDFIFFYKKKNISCQSINIYIKNW